MEHERAERLISERLDGERIARRDLVELERHLEECAQCRAFERGAWRLRESARFEVAPAVPDLVERIMAGVEAGAAERAPGLRVVRPMRLPARRALLPRLAPAVAALLVGALVGSLVVGGPWSDRPPRRAALAAVDVTRGVAGAASALDAYEATFAILERGSAAAPARDLTMHVWFRAPERFRLDVVDHTAYPSPATPTNLRLIVNGDTWYASGPAPCPSATCPEREISIRNREPFSSAAPAPTDLVLPLTALGDPRDVTVIGRGSALGRAAVVVEVPFERAASLFPFLSIAPTIGGEWRPFFARDRVRIWLDEESWFPLRWKVFPLAGGERRAWALRFGLAEEAPSEPIFEVDARSVDLAPPAADVFAVPETRRTEDQGARATSLEEAEARAGFEPVAPAELGGLERYRVVVPVDDRSTVVTYADGLSFLKLAETRSWTGDAPFGGVDVRSEEVALAGGGVGYYEPATAGHGRRLAIHAAGTDVVLETNLPRERLLSVAATLPVVGLGMPEEWRVRRIGGAVVERVSLATARAEAPFDVALPSRLPEGFAVASVELVRIGAEVGVTIFVRDSDVDVGGGTLRLHLEAATRLPPASSARQASVGVGGATGRWTQGRSQLEWVADGVYRSLDGLGLAELLAIAGSIPTGAPATTAGEAR